MAKIAAGGVLERATRTARRLRMADELVLPMHKSMVVQYAASEDGGRELRLYYGGREIDFDEPALFEFGERLAASARFRAGDAAAWAAEGWPRVQGLLEALIAEGVLLYADRVSDPEALALRPEDRPSPLPPGATDAPRSWRDCEAVMGDLAGRPLEAGWLELVVPVFRVAHPALDADGRQLGEGNVFPKPLRLEVPTAWRTCVYPGTRYQPDRPMNVTALKAMMLHWGPIMEVLRRVRGAYLACFPEARSGWTVGHVERLATCVLALPSYLLMREQGAVASGALHPVLSAVFRVTDGLRLAMHQMLFVPIGEAAWAADAPVTAAEIHAYAERNYAFHSEHGVCAGPKIMVEEFLGVLLDGRPPRAGLSGALDPQVEAAIEQIEPAIDYALLGLQAYAAVFSLWPHMTRTYEDLLAAAETWAGDGGPRAMQVRDRLAALVQQIRLGSYLGDEPLRRQRAAAYDDMFAQCARGLRQAAGPPLSRALAPLPLAEAAAEALRAALANGMGGAAGSLAVRAFTAPVAEFVGRTQAVLGVAGVVQAQINRHLNRPQPRRPFSARDLDLHNRLLGETDRRLPYLLDELHTLFGLSITVEAGRVAFGEARSDD